MARFVCLTLLAAFLVSQLEANSAEVACTRKGLIETVKTYILQAGEAHKNAVEMGVIESFDSFPSGVTAEECRAVRQKAAGALNQREAQEAARTVALCGAKIAQIAYSTSSTDGECDAATQRAAAQMGMLP